MDVGTGFQQLANSVLSFLLLSPGSYVTFQWKQNRGGNKQALSSLSVSAAKQPLSRLQQPVRVCVCGKDRCVFCLCICSYMDVLCVVTRKIYKSLPLRPRASGSCSTHRGSFVCHGHSVLNMISTQKVHSPRSLCRVIRVHAHNIM